MDFSKISDEDLKLAIHGSQEELRSRGARRWEIRVRAAEATGKWFVLMGEDPSTVVFSTDDEAEFLAEHLRWSNDFGTSPWMMLPQRPPDSMCGSVHGRTFGHHWSKSGPCAHCGGVRCSEGGVIHQLDERYRCVWCVRQWTPREGTEMAMKLKALNLREHLGLTAEEVRIWPKQETLVETGEDGKRVYRMNAGDWFLYVSPEPLGAKITVPDRFEGLRVELAT